jgi:hypothetical protein
MNHSDLFWKHATKNLNDLPFDQKCVGIDPPVFELKYLDRFICALELLDSVEKDFEEKKLQESALVAARLEVHSAQLDLVDAYRRYKQLSKHHPQPTANDGEEGS